MRNVLLKVYSYFQYPIRSPSHFTASKYRIKHIVSRPMCSDDPAALAPRSHFHSI